MNMSHCCLKRPPRIKCSLKNSILLGTYQRWLILNSLIKSHFSCCSKVWMFLSRKLNERINHIHERILRMVYKGFKLSFQELLIEVNSLGIYHSNLKSLWLKSLKLKMSYHLSSWMMYSSLSKKHTPYEQRGISGLSGSVQQNMA